MKISKDKRKSIVSAADAQTTDEVVPVRRLGGAGAHHSD
jgi:hypothetical protein